LLLGSWKKARVGILAPGGKKARDRYPRLGKIGIDKDRREITSATVVATVTQARFSQGRNMNQDLERSKVPEVTLIFWIIKILATTLGETGGDAVSMSMDLGYAVSSFIFIGIFVTAVATQILAKRFHPFLYWLVVVATTTAGTTMADFADRSLGIGYPGGASLLFVLLLASLAIWYWSAGSISVNTVSTPRIEMFYWVAILFSQTLGTALGDWMADTNGLGYEGGALVFAAGLVLIAVAYFFSSVSRTLLFWAAFILTRPLGATLGDLLDKPLDNGGLAFSRFYASAILAGIIIACVALLPQRAGIHPSARREPETTTR
jgi:uncharacterized membrane-anchored protein